MSHASSLLALALLGATSFALAPLAGCGGETEETETKPEPEPEPEPTAPKLGLNDVSVLLPLPASPSAAGYLGPTSAGAKGELLPEAVYDEIPTFPVKPSQGLDYDRMRVVAIRFDGCFPRPTGCEAQIRLVMQPITNQGRSLDSALHLFYRLDEAELAELVPELRRLRTLAPEVADAPLDVHAGLLAQGAEGAYGAALNEVVLRFAGSENFVRMTFFLRAPPVNEVWFFGGFDQVDGELVPLDISGLGQVNQRVIRTEVAEGYDYAVDPAPPLPEAERVLFTSASAAAATADEREAAFARLLRIENPVHLSPDDLSCAACHMATYINEQTRATYGLDDADYPDEAFASTHDLSVRGGARSEPGSLRAFGWFDDSAMIAQRVVNESAAVVDDLEARFPAE